MKKNLLIAAIAITALASCSSNDFVGDESPQTSSGNVGAISFNMGTKAITRSSDADVTALNSQFIVWGEKSNAAETNAAGTPVFINYVVKYGATTAGTTESNSAGWEYVGQTPYANTKVVASAAPTHVTEQTIKYWDFTNKYYTFTAISALPADITGDLVTVTKNVSGSTVYDKGYTVAVKEGAHIGDIYFSDRELVTASSPMTNPVQLSFRNLLSQVRFGFYETIPGYSVKITDVKFNSTSHTTNAAGNFGVDCSGAVIIPGASTSFTVTYDDGSVTAANQNKAKVAVSGSTTQNYLSTTATSFFGTTLGTSSNARTWENDGNYTKILPNPSNTTDLTLTISYRLTSTDGSGETIDITDATAKVPAAYAQWQANYAYTYLFKITDNYGLYPITFDAVVVNDEAGNQETITTVEAPSITTYAKASNVTTNDEYLTSSNIYVVVDKAGAVQTLTVGTNANLYLVTNNTGEGAAIQEITEASVANALEHGTPTGEPANTWTVTGVGMKPLIVTTTSVPTLTAVSSIPTADSPTGVAIDVNGAKFTPSAAGTYAFEFISRDKATGTYVSGTTYYTAATGDTTVDTSSFEEGVTDVSSYYVGDPKKYYKVIKVVAPAEP